MNILDFGTEIETGEYFLHSDFSSVYNYQKERQIISLVTRDIGRGPNNIVCSKLPPDIPTRLEVKSSQIKFGSTTLFFSVEQKSSADFICEDVAKLQLLIDNLSQHLHFSTDSLAFILQPSMTRHFTSGFKLALSEHVQESLQKAGNDLAEIAKRIKGVGFGLTPSGDDFICGMLYALHYLRPIILDDYQEIIQQVYANSQGNNLISNTFLYYAYKNKYYQNFHEFLSAISDNNENGIIDAAQKITESGHSSGSDMLTGFIFTLKEVLNDQKLG